MSILTLFWKIDDFFYGEVGNADRIWAWTPQNLASERGIATAILLIQLRRSRCVRQHRLRVVRRNRLRQHGG